MFSDPFTSIMALILLAFIGTLVIFFCIWREMDALRRTLQDIRSSMQMYAMDMEQQNRDLATVSRELRALVYAGKNPESYTADLGELLEKGLPNVAQAFPPASGMSGAAVENGAFSEPAATDEGHLPFGDGFPGKRT